jgi:tripartite-type tricarboxylate transporter receptor subunit TctC
MVASARGGARHETAVFPFVFRLFGALPALAQDWPKAKPLHIVVGFGRAHHRLVARLVQPKLQEALGQSVVVENKPGAGGNVARSR